ncbi:bifunctional 4-hydroxy-2-oxoglutarate aldolase/2-dehydro-3-deoxy-phosphogluconate aldolase [Burkholderia vietnamiensis]|uniref:bifunctional 4-hydroxy-2-oxoglutarate aldolase/2-dehydro-3-deoxy-phosphogluconate aldolase n=1 Tax=Burkholderia vietnamiensis TaxID=60552 RepID=UPI001D13ECF6|nr:bifunctional 4-hydroxy-2-oxoglutarate aldolase/2-dehydro-3-deoxy-phosphogluconate aldolase [Burkholderia vietnamiensis]UEC01715.1 bifunctional 4-hydroxy-2-oxoglutarate aldolase/2-dehydro-3-deoxy-phosphogluconate aldolase [Burkholderia vietnamiensis]
MNKSNVLARIGESKIIGIIREKDPDVALEAARACIEGGINCLEIALTTPCGLDVVESLARIDGVVVGAGTVLDPETAKAAIQVGASFLLSPAVDAAVIRMCSKYGVVSVPGAFSPTEVVTALEAGADIVKIFPAATLGPKHIESIAAPLPQAVFLPSGGVTVENFGSWFVSGVIAVGVGGYLTSTAAAGDYASIIAKARRFVEAAERQSALALRAAA